MRIKNTVMFMLFLLPMQTVTMMVAQGNSTLKWVSSPILTGKKRIKGWGSPKLDKVKNTKREDIELPEAWERIIKKPDGSYKKVILLYNTGLRTLLKEGEKLLRKIESTFRIFYEHKNEVALWWRPHPLIPATIDSMRPELKQQYSDIVAKNKNDAWDIYDDTADLHRAITASDAYFGDGSSVTRLFQAAGKPVMIENVEVT